MSVDRLLITVLTNKPLGVRCNGSRGGSSRSGRHPSVLWQMPQRKSRLGPTILMLKMVLSSEFGGLAMTHFATVWTILLLVTGYPRDDPGCYLLHGGGL